MMYILGMAVWLITAVVAIGMGVNALVGFDMLSFVPKPWHKAIGAIIGAAGVLSLF